MRPARLLAYAAAPLAAAAVGAAPHHILFIASDDMRPEMSPYGHNYMSTPNFQRLADDGFTFRRSYVQYALCAPSRTVLLTGRRPDSSRVWTIGPYFRDTVGRNYTTLPQFFKEHGWRSIGHGKIFHEGNASGYPLDQDQAYGSWSVPYFHPSDTYNKFNQTDPNPCPKTCRAPLSNGAVDEPWQTFNDAKSALRAVEWIRNASKYEAPFFLAVGFHRPHIPYIYPKEFEFTGEVQFPPKDYSITQDIPSMAPHDWTGEGMRYADLATLTPSIVAHAPNWRNNLSSLCDAVPFANQAGMKRSYYSCIQYIDHLVGQLLQALEEEGLYDSTTVIFWGDHGYKLGEHCDWFKHDNYEDSTRIPVLVKPAAGLALGLASGGRVLEQLVEEVDIYPSLIDLAGLAVPADLQGESWVPLLRDPGAAGKSHVFNQYTHGKMGYSIRTHEWRYTEWVEFDCSPNDPMKKCAADSSVTPKWGQLAGVELYDHRGDPSNSFGDYENVNLAYQAEHNATVAQLRELLHASWAPPQ